MKQFVNIATLIANLGLLTVMVAVAMPLLHVDFTVARIVLSVGAVVNLAGRVVMQSRWLDCSLHLRRAHRLEVWSALMFCVAAVLTFVRTVGYSDWIAFTLAGALLFIVSSIVVARRERLEQQEKSGK